MFLHLPTGCFCAVVTFNVVINVGRGLSFSKILIWNFSSFSDNSLSKVRLRCAVQLTMMNALRSRSRIIIKNNYSNYYDNYDHPACFLSHVWRSRNLRVCDPIKLSLATSELSNRHLTRTVADIISQESLVQFVGVTHAQITWPQHKWPRKHTGWLAKAFNFLLIPRSTKWEYRNLHADESSWS